MIFTARTISLFFLSAALTVLGLWQADFMYIGLTIAALTLVLIMVEYAGMPGKQQFILQRRINGQLFVNVPSMVRIDLQNKTRQKYFIKLRDEPPDEFEIRHAEHQSWLLPKRQITCEYKMVPPLRGHFRFNDIQLEIHAPFPGLVARRFRYPQISPIHVYPDLSALKKYDLLTMKGRLRNIGFRATRQLGLGSEYESLREYTPDDEYRRINWVASARVNKLITTQYQTEQSQQVVILIDTGRLMGTEALGSTRLDLAIEAAMMLAHVVVRKKDLVGLMVFSNRVHAYLPPKKEKNQLNRMLKHLYNQKSELVESNYPETFEFFKNKCHRRSLVILFTEVIDQYASQFLIQGLTKMYPKHLPLCVTMKDRLMEQTFDQPAQNIDQAYAKAVAAELMSEREDAIGNMRSHGVIVLDVLPEQLTTEVINKYMEIKSRGQL